MADRRDRDWGFPALIVGTMRKLPAGTVKKPNAQDERFRVLASLSNELCAIIAQATPEEREKEMRKLTLRFAEALTLDSKEIQQAVQRAMAEVADFARVIHLNL